MKRLILISALLAGTAAFAQDTEQPATEPETQTTTTPATTPAAGDTVAPSNSNPERDARGIPVISDPAQAPAGANQPVAAPPGARIVPSSNQSAAFTTQQSTEDYPACSKTVTDNCVQTYERGRPR